MKKTVKNTGLFASLLTSIALFALSGCTNMAELKSRATNTLTNPSYLSSSGSYTHTLQGVLPSPTPAVSPTDWKLSLSVASGSLPLTQYCEGGTSATKPCACVLTWVESNTVGGATTSVSRTKKLTVTEVQSSLVKCQMTNAFWDEIPAGTTMHMNIEGVSPNSTGLNILPIGYKKGSSIAPSGDFVDDTLTPFRNIYRYTCYSKRLASHEVLNQYTSGTVTSGSTTTSVNVMVASRFCTGAGTNCQTPRNGYSAQSYYRNLFIRSDKLGEINSTNARYDCPKVFESLSYSATNPPTVPAAEQGKYWPLDTTFAVATTATSEWSVQIPAASVLMKTGDTSAVDDAALVDPNNTNRLKELATSNAGIAWKILGYGKKPNANGTCGTLVDSLGRIRPLTRLRRYRVVYPSTYQNTGQVEQERPEADQVYISDRLVADVSGNLNGNMIYGPKPCNFSWFDHEGVTNRTGGPSTTQFQTNFINSIPTYKSTSNYFYNNGLGDIVVNPDGRVLPNFDRDGAVGGINPASCSAAVSVYDTDATGVLSRARLLTSYVNRTDKLTMGNRDLYLSEIHVNPVERWSPDYVEDTSFQACVPVADPYIEPPLHFYREAAGSGSKVGWCAKVYPTQNPYWSDLNARKKPLGSSLFNKVVNWSTIGGNTNMANVSWFTSHVDPNGAANPAVKATLNDYNSCSSTSVDKICEFSLGVTSGTDYSLCQTFLGSSLGATNNRCDRTVMFDGNQDYRGFPLQSPDADIEGMLAADLAKSKNYACTFSVHTNAAKIGKDEPLTNCCGALTGNSILGVLPNSSGGHLEPFLNPAVPTVRFCGSPVE